MANELNAKDIRNLVGTDSPLILEIGCNDGTDTLKFLETMPRSRVYAFEPDPRAIRRFRENVINHRVTLTEIAVSDTDGEAIFYGSSGRAPAKSRRPGALPCCFLDEWDLSGSLCRPTGHLTYSPWTKFPESRQYQVETIKLDTWLSRHLETEIIDFIWCDVQGAEAMVIRGGANTLVITRYFYTEFYNTPLYEGQLPLSKLQEMLPDFELLGIHGENALFKNVLK